MPRHRRSTPRTAEQVQAHRELREDAQRVRPSLQQLVAAGDVAAVLQQGAMVDYLRAGVLLRAAREQAGWSLADMAEKTGIDRGALSRLENGVNSPTLTTLSRYAEALGMDLRIGLFPGGE